MNQDPAVRHEAHGVLEGLFRHLGESRQASEQSDVLSGLGGQLEEFMSMPLDMAMIFIRMATDLTELVLTSLEEAGIVLVKGLTPM